MRASPRNLFAIAKRFQHRGSARARPRESKSREDKIYARPGSYIQARSRAHGVLKRVERASERITSNARTGRDRAREGKREGDDDDDNKRSSTVDVTKMNCYIVSTNEARLLLFLRSLWLPFFGLVRLAIARAL